MALAVRHTRLRRGWTRETLAHKTGLSWSAITQIETGRRTEVRLSSLDALAGALEVSLDYLVRGEVGQPMLEHRACLFTSPAELAELVAPVAGAGVDAEHAVLIVTTPPNVAAIKKALGAHGKRVQFGDSVEWYRTPTHATVQYEAFTRAALAEGAPWVDIFGEPVWAGRSRAETSAWTRYESIFNALFASWPASVHCLYDAQALPKQVVTDVDRTHPEVVSGDGTRESASYEDPMQFVTA